MKQDRYHGAMTTGSFFCITRAYQAKLPLGENLRFICAFSLREAGPAFFFFLETLDGDFECFFGKISTGRRFGLYFGAVRGQICKKS